MIGHSTSQQLVGGWKMNEHSIKFTPAHRAETFKCENHCPLSQDLSRRKWDSGLPGDPTFHTMVKGFSLHLMKNRDLGKVGWTSLPSSCIRP